MTHANPSLSPRDLEDAFIKVTFEEECRTQTHSAATDPMFDPWVDQGTCRKSLACEVSEVTLRMQRPQSSLNLPSLRTYSR